MKLVAALRAGSHGVRLDFPTDFFVEMETDTGARLRDPVHGVAWSLFFFPNLYLDLSEAHREALQRDVERHVRFLFETALDQDEASEREPRQANDTIPPKLDPTWSPRVDVLHVSLDGGAALEVVHDAHYEPGLETVMGHLLVPLRTGLFEARTMSSAHSTRAEAAHEPSPGDSVRAAHHWLRSSAGLRISDPGKYETGEVTLAPLGCAVTPPPRFVFSGPADAGRQRVWYAFDRVSFSGTDGVDRFLVQRIKERHVTHADAASRLLARADELSREIHEDAEVEQIQCMAERLPDLDGRPQASVVVEGHGHVGALRTAMRWFLDRDDQLWCLAISSTVALSRDDLAEKLEAATRSWRRTDAIT